MSYNGLNTVSMWDNKKNGYKKVKTFVLRDGSHAIIHIPLNKLSQIDRQRLFEIEAKGGEMLTHMRDTTLKNGINALVLYDNLIEVYNKPKVKEDNVEVAETQESTNQIETEQVTQTDQEPKKKKRGRPPKSTQS